MKVKNGVFMLAFLKMILTKQAPDEKMAQEIQNTILYSTSFALGGRPLDAKTTIRKGNIYDTANLG